MIGFDRPLQPEWIYRFIQTVDVGDKFLAHKAEFHKILWELDGSQGKRKVGTVLTRYFLKQEDSPNSQYVEQTPIYQIVKGCTLEAVKPLLLFQLLMRSEMLRLLTRMIYELYGRSQSIHYDFLRKKAIEKLGGREISSRSLRNFLKTLVAFEVLRKANQLYEWKQPLEVSEQNFCDMLKLYAEEYKKSPQILLDELENYLFLYFHLPDIGRIGQKYNKILWDYSQTRKSKQIMFTHVTQPPHSLPPLQRKRRQGVRCVT